MTELADSYLERRKAQVAFQTWRNKRTAVTRLAREWDKTRRSPARMNDTWLEDFLISLRAGERGVPMGAAAYNQKLKNLTEFVEWMHRRRHVTNTGLLDLFETLKLKEYRRENFTRLSLVQLHQLVESGETERDRFILAFGAFTLGRSSELLRCQIKDVLFDEQEINWYRQKTDDHDRMPMMAPLETALRRWLRMYAEQCPEAVINGRLSGDAYLIPRRRQTGTVKYRLFPFEPADCIRGRVRKHLLALLNVQEMKGEACHVLRRSGARVLYDQMVAAGAKDALRIVSAMLGHASVRTTERYLGTAADRRNRDDHLKGSDLMGLPTVNVVQLRSVGSGS